MDRDQQLLDLRSKLPVVTENALPDEQFQNLTLRPILKLQHHLLLAIFRHYLEEKSIKFSAMTAFKQRLIIENAVKKDLPLRHMLTGCVAGLFTAGELNTFLANRVALNKRIADLIIQRFSDELIKPTPPDDSISLKY